MNWSDFEKLICPTKNNCNYQRLSCENGHVTLYTKNEDISVMYFGFLSGQMNTLIPLILEHAKKNNIKKIIGPIDGNSWNNYRFQNDINILEKYPGQPTYEKSDLEIFLQNGFKVFENYESIELNSLQDIKDVVAPFGELINDDLVFSKIPKDFFKTHGHQFQNLLNDIFSENVGFSQLTDSESEYITAMTANMLNPDFTFVAFNKENEAVGFLMNFFKDGILYFKTLGFRKDSRHQGLSTLSMLSYFVNEIGNHKIYKVIVCLMRSGNFPSLFSQDYVAKKNNYVLIHKEL